MYFLLSSLHCQIKERKKEKVRGNNYFIWGHMQTMPLIHSQAGHWVHVKEAGEKWKTRDPSCMTVFESHLDFSFDKLTVFQMQWILGATRDKYPSQWPTRIQPLWRQQVEMAAHTAQKAVIFLFKFIYYVIQHVWKGSGQAVNKWNCHGYKRADQERNHSSWPHSFQQRPRSQCSSSTVTQPLLQPDSWMFPVQADSSGVYGCPWFHPSIKRWRKQYG